MAISLISLILSLTFKAHADETKLYQCYSRVAVRGKLETADSAMKRVAGVFLVFNKVHVPVSKDVVMIDAIIGVAGVNQAELPSMLDEQWVKRLFVMAGVEESNVTSRYLGCSEQTLKP